MAGGSSSDALASVTLLLSCAAASLVTSMAVHLYFQAAAQEHEHQSAPTSTSSTTKSYERSANSSSPSEEAVIAPLPPPIVLQNMPADEVPEALRLDAYVSLENQKRFAHATLFKGCTNVFAVLDAIHPYAVRFFDESLWMQDSVNGNAHITILKASSKRERDSRWRLPECIDPEESAEILLYPGVDPLTFAPDKIINLPASTISTTPMSTKAPQKKRIVILPGSLILGGTFDVSGGSIYIGKNVRIEPNVFIRGPAIIDDGSTLRSGAYIRGDVVIGRDVVLRGELKNALVLDQAELCHPGYCGDSICGFKSHFGNQVTTANLNLFSGSSSVNLTIDVDGQRYDTGRKKIGVVLGDHSQLGCSVVTDPCTLLLQNTVAYPLARLRKDIYGPNQLIKNKPMEHGVLEIASFRLTR